MDYDMDAKLTHGLESFADDLLVSLRRWLCDVSAVHMINTADEAEETEGLSEAVRKNTVFEGRKFKLLILCIIKCMYDLFLR